MVNQPDGHSRGAKNSILSFFPHVSLGKKLLIAYVLLVLLPVLLIFTITFIRYYLMHEDFTFSRLFAAMGGWLVVLSAVTCWLVRKDILIPVYKLVEMMSLVRCGFFSQTSSAKGKDEIGEICTMFMEMIKNMIKMNGELGTRTRYQEILSECQKILSINEIQINIKQFDLTLKKLMRYICTSSGISRLSLFENFFDNHGNRAFRLIISVVSDDSHVRDGSDEDILPDFDFYACQWFAQLACGEIISIPVDSLQHEKRIIMKSNGIYRTVIVPIFVRGVWHGSILCENPEIDDNEDDIVFSYLKQISIMLGGFIDKISILDNMSMTYEKSKLLTEAISENIFILDINSLRFTYINKALTMHTGYSIGEGRELKLEDILNEEDFKAAMILLEDELGLDGNPGIDHNRVKKIDMRMKVKDGGTIWVEATFSFLRNENGKAWGILGVSRDITKRKEVEDVLRTNEEKMRALLNVTTRSLTMIDPLGFILVMNEYEAQRLGRRVEDVLGHSIYEYYPPDVVELRTRMIGEVVRTRKSIHFDEVIHGVIYDTYMYPVFNHDGAVERLAIYCRDITRQRRLEKEILDISEKERIRIGHDLHDGVGQYFTGIGYMTRLLIDKLREREVPEVSIAEEIMGLINEAKSHVRILSKGLCPVHMNESGLISALHELCMNIEKIYEISCKLVYDKKIEIADNSVATHLYYIIREAIHNAIKHGNAKNIDVGLLLKNNKLEVSIRDDGFGFDEHYEQKDGLGLNLMRYRSDIIRAALSIGLDDSGKTMISCILNMNNEVHSAGFEAVQ